MSRISDILVRVRDTLADPKGIRFSDARLLRLLDEGQKQIVLNAKLLRKKTTLPVIAGVAEYSLPEDCYRITRILYEDEALELKSHEDLDKFAVNGIATTNWETTEGTIQYIIFDKLNGGVFKVYPIPEASSYLDIWMPVFQTSAKLALYGVVSDITGYELDSPYGLVSVLTSAAEVDAAMANPYYGMIAGITEYTIEEGYGMPVTFSDDVVNIIANQDPDIDAGYGFISAFSDEDMGLTLYYLKRPEPITGISDELEIGIEWDIALKYFITGMALRDDRDTQNRQIGSEELNFFSMGLREAMEVSAQDFTAVRTQYDTPYTGGF